MINNQKESPFEAAELFFFLVSKEINDLKRGGQTEMGCGNMMYLTQLVPLINLCQNMTDFMKQAFINFLWSWLNNDGLFGVRGALTHPL